MKAVVAAFNQEKALVGAFSVIVQLYRLIVNSSISSLILGHIPGINYWGTEGLGTRAPAGLLTYIETPPSH